MNMVIAWFLIFPSVCVYFYYNISYCVDREQQQDQHQDPESGECFFATCSLKFKAVIWVWPYLTSSLFFLVVFCRGRGVLDNQPGSVPEHQHHVHALSEPSHSPRSGSQHQVRWCVHAHTFEPLIWMNLPLIPLGLRLHCCSRLANGSASLIAVGNTSRSEFIKHLKRYSSSGGQVRSAAIPSSFRTNHQECHSSKMLKWLNIGC